jgi:hypothetical protein
VQEYIQKYYFSLKFSPAVETVVKDIKRNPKRMQSEAKKQMQEPPTVLESKPRPQEQSFYKAAEPSVAQPNIPQSPSNNINIDTSKVETILNSQLESLKQVVTLLSSIDGKFDIDKLNNITKPQGMIQAGGKSIPQGSVNLSTKM